jgi:dihydrofolate reductase
MGKLIYSMITSVDGYVSDPEGNFGWGAPDEESHEFVAALSRSIGTYLYGRRMYETMLYWETAHTVPDQPPFILEFARIWGPPTKSFTPRRSTRSPASGPESSGHSTPTRCGN